MVVDVFFKLHKDVFSKLGSGTFAADRNLEDLDVAPSGLHRQVA